MSNIAKVTSLMNKEITETVNNAYIALSSDFKTESYKNEDSAKAHDMHVSMVDYIIQSTLASQFKKAVDRAKELLDEASINLGLEPNIPAGTSQVMWTDNIYTFTKKRNVDSNQVSAKDLVIQLTILGVEKGIIDKAMSKANKVRRGNTYYNVSEN